MTELGSSAKLERVLADVLVDMKKAHACLTIPEIQAQLSTALHDPDKLPGKKTSALAAEIVDVIGDIDHLLEPDHLVLADQFFGFYAIKCLVAAVRRGIPDILASSGPQTASELAASSGCHPLRLQQIMRNLSHVGIFTYSGDHSEGLYSNNSRSQMLCRDHWTQWHLWVELYGNQLYDMAGGIPECVKVDSTRSAGQHAFNTDSDMFSFFEAQGWLPQLHQTMGAGATAQAAGICKDYPWHEIGDKLVVDVGCGGGALIAALLRDNPSMRGGLCDLSSVIEHVRPRFLPGGDYEDLGPRVDQKDIQAVDFFHDQIPAAEVFVMKWVLHDWADEDVRTILCNIRRAIQSRKRNGSSEAEGFSTPRLVVLESVLAGGRSQRLSRYGDINVMITAKGQERSEKQWKELAADAGWEIARIYPLRNAWVSAIDLRPVSVSRNGAG